ncbi:hypothetical protein Bca52824_010431 [Brassica carinata]|uniref:Uncharacterized protein n=1 Tax=Brassica carinata TaxID=52824 RepID=A0A8X7WG27_BRACI|nr:hypothetical protein Bca52824_010431 [Brassica carinata]
MYCSELVPAALRVASTEVRHDGAAKLLCSFSKEYPYLFDGNKRHDGVRALAAEAFFKFPVVCLLSFMSLLISIPSLRSLGDHCSDASGETNSQGVTGGVYRARVHIHRGMLIRDY